MANTDSLTQKHYERASVFHGRRINGVEHVTLAMAVQMAEVSRQTFCDKCRRYGIRALEYDSRTFYERQKILDAIGNGLFDKRIRHNP